MNQMPIRRHLLHRLVLALTTVPRPADWAFAAVALLAFAAVALPAGLATGVLSPGPGGTWPRLLVFAAVAVVAPSLGEELAFRAALLPHPSEGWSVSGRAARAAAAVSLFVLWHPLNAALFLPAARPLFYDVRFLALAAWLGACCAAVYLRTGSVWPPAALHWAAVVGWKAAFGGPLTLLGA
ncbi:MAG: CPBP family glutamic-type intramembrane protease [Gemmataceae bacterium]